MYRILNYSVLVLICIGVCTVGSAQDIAKLDIYAVDATEFPVNYVYYTAKNLLGKDAGALSGEVIKVYEDGVEQRLWSEQEERVPASLVLILDSSGSMKQTMQDVLIAAKNLVTGLETQDQAEIIDFDSKVKVAQTFTHNKQSLSNVLDAIVADGGTALYDATAQGITDSKKRTGLKAIVLLTDGKDENAKGDGPGSTLILEQLKTLLVSSNIPVFTIGLGAGIDKPVLEAIASTSGGKAYYAKDANAVDKIYSEIITYLHSLHRFFYITHNGVHDNTQRKVLVKANNQLGIPKTEMSYTAPLAEYWSYAFTPAIHKEWCVSNLAISPDGKYIAALNKMCVLSNKGFRYCINWDGVDAYEGVMTTDYHVHHRGWLHTGNLYKFNGKNLDEVDPRQLLMRAGGFLHLDWGWQVKGISKGGKYAVFASRPEGDPRKYYFLLYDMTENKILWEKHLYAAEFDEPNDVAVSDNGIALITQDFNLFALNKSGEVLFSWMWEQTGNRFLRLGITADGSKFIARIPNKSEVQVYSINGNLLWKIESKSNEDAGPVDVSPNGLYFAINDQYGPRIFDAQGKLLFQKKFTEPAQCDASINGVAVANDGSFVYSLGPRMYYSKIK
jgi:VWFA-related protein